MNTKRICLWSSPRNLSTALMYSFSQRPDTMVVDEPLYAHYLRDTGADHPGRAEILQSQENDGEKVVAEMLHKDYGQPVVFFKQMTHHLVNLPTGFLKQTNNILYIRDPKQIISSYAQVRPHVEQADIGIRMQWELFSDLSAAGISFTILDSGELLKDPPKVLSLLCEAMEIPFYGQMLSWPAGPSLKMASGQNIGTATFTNP